jgi:hypothetical protein
MKRRIIRADALNWAIQEFQTGGDTIERGRYAGQEKQARWKAPEMFFARLEDAAKRFFQEEVGDTVPEGEAIDLQALLVAIPAAEARTMSAVKEAADALETSLLIGILQERGYKVTDGQKGRTSYADDSSAEPEEDTGESP